ncbi:SGNH/GDSL hydrolase family protein [Palleronia sp. LCG004]|uniref:SGNH/GDSL hydrolase family protein n=1 Tax=Palleronia sp. LCG004 TaxID=3079304 RepID=UPI002943C88C|nr:SGNH/GDSL hydrolase family protein [Palleronia sp. LCG004]WOI57771.1 SGNH/GDSL hydrolase family protein [Palleronia sp. LCG004]
MKSVLAYGDSLTWGADPVTTLRHPHADLWPSVLEAGLSGLARVIHDGVGGRTTCFDDHSGPCCRNSVKTLPVALAAHMPLDLVILMLGTNDLKPIHGATAANSQAGIRRLVQLTRTQRYKPKGHVPEILVVAPPACRQATGRMPDGPDRIPQSLRFPSLYADVAREEGAHFFDAATVATASEEDGVHLHRDQTRAIGSALIEPVARILGLSTPPTGEE